MSTSFNRPALAWGTHFEDYYQIKAPTSMIVYLFEIDKPFLMEWCEKLPPSDHSFGYCDLSTFIHQIAHNFKNAKLYLFVVEFYPCWASRGIAFSFSDLRICKSDYVYYCPASVL